MGKPLTVVRTSTFFFAYVINFMIKHMEKQLRFYQNNLKTKNEYNTVETYIKTF